MQKCNIDVNNLSEIDIENLIFEDVNNNDKYVQKCPECNSTNFIEDFSKGMILCLCGQMIETIYDDSQEKKYLDDNQTARCGMVHNKLLPQSSLGTMINARGKLRKLHIWNAMPYKERSDNIMFKKIHNVCLANNICRKIEDDAKIICKKVSATVHKDGKNKGKYIITRGFNRAGIIAACVFIACRRNNATRSTKEIASYFNNSYSKNKTTIDERDVNKGLRSMISILNDNTILDNIGTSNVIDFIKRKCDELQIKRKYTELAITIAKNIEKLNIASNHTTFSLAAASILLMADIHNIQSITKKKLSEAFENLSDVTIGKTYNQLKYMKSLLIDNGKVDLVMKDIEKQKSKKLIKKEIWVKMEYFDIDTSKYNIDFNDLDMKSYIDIYYKISRIINNDIKKLKNLDNENKKCNIIINKINNNICNLDKMYKMLKI
jgi:transcription initiation factor TFIIB